MNENKEEHEPIFGTHRPIVDHARHIVAIVRRKVHAARAPKDVRKRLTRAPDDRCVDDLGEFLDLVVSVDGADGADGQKREQKVQSVRMRGHSSVDA